jgi:hypothetical protein
MIPLKHGHARRLAPGPAPRRATGSALWEAAEDDDEDGRPAAGEGRFLDLLSVADLAHTRRTEAPGGRRFKAPIGTGTCTFSHTPPPRTLITTCRLSVSPPRLSLFLPFLCLSSRGPLCHSLHTHEKERGRQNLPIGARRAAKTESQLLHLLLFA